MWILQLEAVLIFFVYVFLDYLISVNWIISNPSMHTLTNIGFLRLSHEIRWLCLSLIWFLLKRLLLLHVYFVCKIVQSWWRKHWNTKATVSWYIRNIVWYVAVFSALFYSVYQLINRLGQERLIRLIWFHYFHGFTGFYYFLFPLF